MSGRLADDGEVKAWREVGWVVLDGLIGVEEIDAATADLAEVFPAPVAYQADPDGERQRWLGQPPADRDGFVWPATGPGFRPEQHRWGAQFPVPGSGMLNRLC